MYFNKTNCITENKIVLKQLISEDKLKFIVR